MSLIKTRLALPLALVATIAMSSMAVAQCTTCSSSCNQAWPSADCCSNCCSGTMCSELEKFKEHCALITARNDAWPMPFTCWDREAYYAIWNQQFGNGLQVAHLLTPEYFDANTNELNRAGELRVAWIMQNAPINEKKIFVYEDQNGPVMDQRMANVRGVVDRWYGHMGNVEIATSQLPPNRIPASYQQVILEKVGGAQPPAIIPIGSSGNISSSVN